MLQPINFDKSGLRYAFGEKTPKTTHCSCTGGIHVSVYMHINVCTMIVQNDNAQVGAQNPQRGREGNANHVP